MTAQQATARGSHIFRQLLLSDDAMLASGSQARSDSGIDCQRRQVLEGQSPPLPIRVEKPGVDLVRGISPYTEDTAHWIASQLEKWFAVIGLTYVMQTLLRVCGWWRGV